tara:strand:+ start:50846 stop:51325 length:480 start_codon:yes stop_codon:yes gene_type:complete
MPPIAILVALADPTRCRLIELLRDGPQPVHVLAAAFKISRPAISRHLRVLKQSGLISENKFGRENRYALHPGKLAPVQRWLTTLLPPPKAIAVPPALATASKRVSKSRPAPDAVAVVADETAIAPALARATPASLVEPAPAAPAKPRKPAPVSQMGFDF